VSAAPGTAAPAAAFRTAFPGLVVSAMLASIAFLLADQPLFKDTLHLSALLLVILVGMALRTIIHVPAWAAPGVRVAQRPVLLGVGKHAVAGEPVVVPRPEYGRLVRRPGRERVPVEPGRIADRADVRDVLLRVAEPKLLLGRRPSLAPLADVLEQDGEPLGPLRVVLGRVEARERGVRQDVDRTLLSSSSSGTPPARASPSR